jgi:hypothetical protein
MAFFFISVILGSYINAPVSLVRNVTVHEPSSSSDMRPSTGGHIASFNFVDLRGMGISYIQTFTVSSFEGIVNKDRARLLILYSNDYLTWVNEIQTSGLYNITSQTFSTLNYMLGNYSTFIKGVILFDSDMNESANIATPLCGLHDAVMVEKSALSSLPALASKPIVVNLTAEYKAQGFNKSTSKGQIYRWAFDKWGAQCNQTALAMFNAGNEQLLRSYLAGRAIFTTWQPNHGKPKDPDGDLATFDYILDKMPADIIVLGWMGNDEGATVSELSMHRKYIVATDFCKNLPFLQLLPLPPGYKFQQNRSTVQLPLENKVYVAGMYSDGDNAQYDQNFMKEILWDAPGRGAWPICFELQMQLINLAPFIMYRYYQDMTTNDSFVQGVGGKGYVYWDKLPTDFMPTFLSETLDMMEKTDMHQLRTWFEKDFPSLVKTVKSMPNASACKGICEGYVNTHPYELPLVYGGMPVCIMTGMDYNKDGNDTSDEYMHVLSLRTRATNGPVFIMFHLMAWQISIAEWNDFCARLSRFGDVEIVGVEQFMDLLSKSQVGQVFADYTAINLIIAWGLVAIAALVITKPLKHTIRKEELVKAGGEP